MAGRNNTRSRKHLVILGGGFAGISLLKRIDLKQYEVTIISPRNHFLFTPLLPSTTVGTIEFRSIIEPIRKARRGVQFMQGKCTSLNDKTRRITCENPESGAIFTVDYDYLVIAVGAWNNTFGVPGVSEYAFFLKELGDARNIRERVISCLERASIPGISNEERDRLLHIVIVGGGPTGVEFAAELHDLLDEDLKKSYPHLVGKVRITLFEAMKTILSTFDAELRNYTVDHFRRQGIEVRLETPVQEVCEDRLILKSGEEVPTGLIVWSTGYGPTGLVSSLPYSKEKGRLLTDEYLRIPDHPEIYAMGDCATIAGGGLPQTAQLAMQTGKYLAGALNDLAEGKQPDPFKFKNLGMLAYVGENRALADLPNVDVQSSGVGTYIFWRSAYLTRLVSFKNKVLVLFDWLKTWIFGRDLSKF
jgi:NADH:ubiquinone reductase (non-electrogenic)